MRTSGPVSKASPSPAALAAYAQINGMTKADKLAMMTSRPAEWNELCRLKAEAESFQPTANLGIKQKAASRMGKVDAMALEFRDCVNRHGLGIVQAFLDHGVKSARSIDYLIDQVRNINDGRPANFGNHRTKAIRRMCADDRSAA